MPETDLSDVIASGFDAALAASPARSPVDGEAVENPNTSPAPEYDDEFAGDIGNDPPDADRIPHGVLAACALEPQNDTGNGQRLIRHFGDGLLHVRDVGWHAWDGKRWRKEGGDELVTLAAQRTAPRIAIEANHLAATQAEQRAIDAADDVRGEWIELDQKKNRTDAEKSRLRELERVRGAGTDAREALADRQISRRRFAVSSGNGTRIRAMIDQALPHISVAPDALDGDPLAFNVANGTLRFVQVKDDECPDPDADRTKWAVVLRPHWQDDRISKLAPVTYDPDIKAPKFCACLERFQPNRPTREFLQRYTGYAMTGLAGEQCLIFNYGAGANWKSTFLDLVCKVLGDYSQVLQYESIAGDGMKQGAQASPDIARLPAARAVRVTESERGTPLKESLIKSLTGGEPMLARHNYGNFFEFYPVFKLFMSGNYKPQIGGVDYGIWRRIRLVLWPVTMPEAEKRPITEVIEELYGEEASGILNWLIEGALAYLNDGLKPPQEVIEATEAYREEMDPVGCFIAQCIERLDPQAGAAGGDIPSETAHDVYRAYIAWCDANSVLPFKQKGFAGIMSQKGYERDRTKTTRRYVWVKLHDVPIISKSESPPPADPADYDVPV